MPKYVEHPYEPGAYIEFGDNDTEETILETLRALEPQGPPAPAPKPRLTTVQKWSPTAARLAGPLVGSVLAGVPGLIAGAGIGEQVAQEIELATQQREKRNLLGTAIAMGGATIGPAGPAASKMYAVAKGALTAAAENALYQASEGVPLSDMGPGVALSAATGGLGGYIVRGKQRQALKTQREAQRAALNAERQAQRSARIQAEIDAENAENARRIAEEARARHEEYLQRQSEQRQLEANAEARHTYGVPAISTNIDKARALQRYIEERAATMEEEPQRGFRAQTNAQRIEAETQALLQQQREQRKLNDEMAAVTNHTYGPAVALTDMRKAYALKQYIDELAATPGKGQKGGAQGQPNAQRIAEEARAGYEAHLQQQSEQRSLNDEAAAARRTYGSTIASTDMDKARTLQQYIEERAATMEQDPKIGAPRAQTNAQRIEAETQALLQQQREQRSLNDEAAVASRTYGSAIAPTDIDKASALRRYIEERAAMQGKGPSGAAPQASGAAEPTPQAALEQRPPETSQPQPAAQDQRKWKDLPPSAPPPSAQPQPSSVSAAVARAYRNSARDLYRQYYPDSPDFAHDADTLWDVQAILQSQGRKAAEEYLQGLSGRTAPAPTGTRGATPEDAVTIEAAQRVIGRTQETPLTATERLTMAKALGGPDAPYGLSSDPTKLTKVGDLPDEALATAFLRARRAMAPTPPQGPSTLAAERAIARASAEGPINPTTGRVQLSALPPHKPSQLLGPSEEVIPVGQALKEGPTTMALADSAAQAKDLGAPPKALLAQVPLDEYIRAERMARLNSLMSANMTRGGRAMLTRASNKAFMAHRDGVQAALEHGLPIHPDNLEIYGLTGGPANTLPSEIRDTRKLADFLAQQSVRGEKTNLVLKRVFNALQDTPLSVAKVFGDETGSTTIISDMSAYISDALTRLKGRLSPETRPFGPSGRTLAELEDRAAIAWATLRGITKVGTLPKEVVNPLVEIDMNQFLLAQKWDTALTNAAQYLTPAELSFLRHNGRGLVRGTTAIPDNMPNLRVYMGVYKDVMNDVHAMARGPGRLDTNYDPQYFTQKLTPAARQALISKNANPALREAILKASNVAEKDAWTIEQKLNDLFYDELTTRHYGPLERERQLQLPESVVVNGKRVQVLDVDGLNVPRQYVRMAARRIGAAMVGGPNTQDFFDKLHALTIDRAGANWEVASKQFKSTVQLLQGVEYDDAAARFLKKGDWFVDLLNSGLLTESAIPNALAGWVPAAALRGLSKAFGIMKDIHAARLGLLQGVRKDQIDEILQMGDKFGLWLKQGYLEGLLGPSATIPLSQRQYAKGAQTGIRAVLEAHPARQLARQSGQVVTKVTGVDAINRDINKLGAIAVNDALDEALAAAKNKQPQMLADLADFLHWSPEHVNRVLNTGLTEEDRAWAARVFISRSNAMYSLAVDTRRPMTHPALRAVFAFTSIVRSLGTLASLMAQQARRGNWKPITRLVFGLTSTMALNDYIKDTIHQRDRRDQGYMDLLAQSIFMSGLLGMQGEIAQDVMSSLKRDRTAQLGREFAIGHLPPAWSQLDRLGAILAYWAQGEYEKRNRAARRLFPVLDTLMVQLYGASPLDGPIARPPLSAPRRPALPRLQQRGLSRTLQKGLSQP
jgi:hypothetical protein